MYVYKSAVITLLLLVLVSCQKNIQGEWISENPEKTATGLFGIREFSIGKFTWEVR